MCIGLHKARPVQRPFAADLAARTRSVSARPCPGALPTLHTQKLSRTPQTRPINDRPPTQTCWSAACAYAERREQRRYLVAGALFRCTPEVLGGLKRAGRLLVPTQPCVGLPTQVWDCLMMAPETLQRSFRTPQARPLPPGLLST